jgi:AcrR family transcriptional regulator
VHGSIFKRLKFYRRPAVRARQKNGVREPVQQRGKEKKERIITAARKLLNHNEYEAVTTNLIAAEAGVSVGTFYAYFMDKRDVFLEVIREYSRDIFGELMANMKELKQGPQDLEEVVRHLILVAKKRHDHEKGLHKQMLVQSIRDPEIRELSLMEEGRADSLIREILDRYADQIDVKDVDAAIFLVTTCVEEMIHHLIIHGSGIPEERVFEELARMVYRYLARR